MATPTPIVLRHVCCPLAVMAIPESRLWCVLAKGLHSTICHRLKRAPPVLPPSLPHSVRIACAACIL